MSLDDILDQKDSIYDIYLSKIDQLSNETQELFLRKLNRLLTKQSTKGYLDKGVRNISILNSLVKELYDAMEEVGLVREISEITRVFDETLSLNIKIQSDLSNLDISNYTPTTIQKEFIKDISILLFGNNYLSPVIKPVHDILFKAIISGASLETTAQAIKIAVGEGTTLAKYATQITRDTLYGYDGALNKAIADEFNMNAFQYVGSLKIGGKGKKKNYESRPQCKRWVNKNIIKYNELKEELDWAYRYGSGMIPGTTADNFSINRGGYNCRHSAIPIRVN